MVEVTEILIEDIKKYPVLYDPRRGRYKSISEKDNIWDTIAREMPVKTTGEELKRKWKNLRDCYAKFLHCEKTSGKGTGRFAARYKHWCWSQQMNFFKPYIKQRTKRNFQIKKDTEMLESDKGAFESEDSTQQYLRYSPTTSINELKHEVFATKNPSISEELIIDPLHKENGPRYNEVEMTFLGYAASVKKLSARRQCIIKYRMAKLIMEAELAELAEVQDEQPNEFL